MIFNPLGIIYMRTHRYTVSFIPFYCRQDCHGENLLEKLYTNPQRWSFQFQSYIQLTRLQELKAPLKDGANVRLLERSIQSNKYCFIELAKNNKDLCKEEASVLEKW